MLFIPIPAWLEKSGSGREESGNQSMLKFAERLKYLWENLTTPRYRVSVEFMADPATNFMGAYATRVSDRNYAVHISPQHLNDPSVLAHELGHLMDFIRLGESAVQLGLNDYANRNKDPKAHQNVIKFEASAWRNAKKIYDKLDRGVLKSCFSSYLKKPMNFTTSVVEFKGVWDSYSELMSKIKIPK
jgi:uncharacterized protein YozE (UPF0346 family)